MLHDNLLPWFDLLPKSIRIAPNTERITRRIDETVAEIATPFGYTQDSPT